MGRELQKKKNRSSIPRHTKRRNPRIHKIKSFGNQIIAQNWNKNETLQQNYKRLGLAVKLKKPTGGVEKVLSTTTTNNPPPALTPTTPTSLAPHEALIQRDPTTGKITNIIYGASGTSRLDLLEDSLLTPQTQPPSQEPTTEVVKQLIEQASRGAIIERSLSEREREWIERLVEKYGEDYRRMAWDRRLNPMQQSEGDIKKRVGKWMRERERVERRKKAGEAAA